MATLVGVLRFSVDGHEVAGVERGSGDPPLLLVHGFTGSYQDFEAVLGDLARHRRCVALDLPGHGGSDPLPAGTANLATVAQWLVRAADALDLGELHLLGHSLGGLVSQHAALRASHRLRSLILADTGLGAPPDEALERIVAIAHATKDGGVPAAWEASQRVNAERVPVRPPDPARDEFARRRFLGLRPDAILSGARMLLSATPLMAFLRGIDVPVLVVHGEHDDVWTAVEQRQLAETVRGARRVVVPDSRHSPQLENPRAWIRAVNQFLQEVDGQSASKAGTDQ